jgi:Zn-finger nucleic acid-binding protein
MKCPNCEETLMMTDRQGVEIDYCPKCRGVWLDRGELDKLIERSAGYTPEEGQQNYPPPQQQYRPQQEYGKPPYDPYYKHKKKKGFLGDFFDFD